jgi:iron complex outermembrane recepter protein
MNRRPTPLQAAISLVLVVAATGTAGAQAPAGSAALEEVVVTGSRIQRDPNETAPAPIASVTAEDLRASGQTDTTSTLRQIPALISSGTVADSIERGAGGVGQAVLNLRQLGANRTLVLVDGYRHVSGVAGSQAVDVSTIPSALIERVDVLTGGASAVYGADAVTGVVNYVLRQDFEGFEFDFQPGISSEGDGESYRLEGTWGKNYADGRGNLTVSMGYTDEAEVLLGDRSFTANNGRANNSTTYDNPALTFQRGDINPATMPNFASFYTLANGLYPFGFLIPTPDDVADLFPSGLTAAEQALVDRAANAPLYRIGRDPRFAISSGQGLIFRRDFGFFGTDINNNGIPDCDESFIGSFGLGGGGCYVSTPGGGVKIFEDGLVANEFNQFGGDGAVERTNQTSLIPGSERFYTNVRGRWDFTESMEGFVDAKFARNETVDRNNYNTFYDALLIYAENPYIPAVLQAEADDAGGLRVSRDMLDLGPGIQESERETVRVVAGLRGDLTDHLRYEVVGNYGQTDTRITDSNTVLYDRLFAAIDVITGPNGQPICRSDVDASRTHPGSQFFPVIRPGFFTFTPGDGQCKPANILSGEQSISAEAVDFITQQTTTRYKIEQTVFTASLAGDSGQFFELPGGAMKFAFGGEYREEKSDSRFDPLLLGLLPEGSPAGAPGTFIGDISPNKSLVFDAQSQTFNTGGEFDVKEVFAEISLPLLSGARFAEELTLGAAGRYADYSTIGGATTWNVNAIWAPVQDVRLRGTYASAIRAPDIFELFSPQQGATFRPSDPCNQATIDALLASGAANAQNRLNNCRADGLPEGYRDPLTARFNGTSGGNPDLSEEEATSWTLGFVLQPRWTPGLLFSVDYYTIEIEDAVAAVTAQDIVNTCYDLDTFPNQFCGLFERNRDPLSPTFLGFSTLRQTQLNFGRIETAGVDFRVDYRFAWDVNNFALSLTGNWVDKLDRFFDPVNKGLVNPGLKELGAPEWAGLFGASWNRDAFTLTYRMQYIGEQAVASVIQVERIDLEFGDAGWGDEYFVHDLSASFDWKDQFTFYGGVSNLTNEKPFIASSAYPVSGMGRFYFIGVKARL